MRASQGVLEVKNLHANAGDGRDASSVPELGRSPGEENGNPLQQSYLGNPMDRGAWWAIVQRVARVGHDLGLNHNHKHRKYMTHSRSSKNGSYSVG